LLGFHELFGFPTVAVLDEEATGCFKILESSASASLLASESSVGRSVLGADLTQPMSELWPLFVDLGGIPAAAKGTKV
jgi:hypothetical protein